MAQPLWEQVEQRHGKPMLELLEELFKQHKTQSAVARVIGVPQPTLWGWLVQLQVQPETTVRLVPRLPKRDGGDGHTTQIADGQLTFLG